MKCTSARASLPPLQEHLQKHDNTPLQCSYKMARYDPTVLCSVCGAHKLITAPLLHHMTAAGHSLQMVCTGRAWLVG